MNDERPLARTARVGRWLRENSLRFFMKLGGWLLEVPVLRWMVTPGLLLVLYLANPKRRRWPFDVRIDSLVTSCACVVERGEAILRVVHHPAGEPAWSFLCAGQCRVDDRRSVFLEDLLDEDPSLYKLPRLQPGSSATRKRVGRHWVVRRT